ncbi:MAG: hypothetical protein ABSF41_08605 [Pseudolabrys sp.]
MRHRQRFALMAAALVAGGAFAMPATRGAAFAGNNVAAIDPGFVPDTGQINRGFDEKVPSSAQARPIPTPAQVSAALTAPDPNQPAPGAQAVDANANVTTGANPPGAQAAAPIGATGQTMPAKFSQRNDTLDRVPIMALPLALSDQDRQRIYQAAMADNTAVADDAAGLAPASELNVNQALNETHPLPASVRGISGVEQLGYVKTKPKVFLVEPATRIVVDEITS